MMLSLDFKQRGPECLGCAGLAFALILTRGKPEPEPEPKNEMSAS